MSVHTQTVLAGLLLLAPAQLPAQGRIDYSRVANYCPSQAFKQQNPKFLINVRNIKYPRNSPEYQDRLAQYKSAYEDRLAEAVTYCERSLSRDPYRPWP